MVFRSADSPAHLSAICLQSTENYFVNFTDVGEQSNTMVNLNIVSFHTFGLREVQDYICVFCIAQRVVSTRRALPKQIRS